MKLSWILSAILCFQMSTVTAQYVENASALTDTPPRLSPRPQSLHEVRQSCISLDGIWKFTGGKAVNENIEVPGEWEMQGFRLDSAATARYVRTFVVPEDWKNKRIKLRFDAVSSHCIIKVNGKRVGEHEGSFVPFELDITNQTNTGNNRLDVDVRCQTISDILASTSQYAGHPVGGILRKVTLFALPDINIAAMTYVTVFDKEYKDATLRIPFEVANEGNKAGKAVIAFELKNSNGKTIPLAENKFVIGNVPAGRLDKDTVALRVQSPEKWNPAHPYLYTLTTKLIVDGKICEEHSRKIGFRQVEIRGNQLFVNNHPVKLHGVCRHSIDPFTGRSVSPALCIKDAVLFRDGNCNYIRTSHYPPEEEFLDACDSLGLFVESESSLCWIGHHANHIWQRWDYANPTYLPYMINANLEKMIADRNHPSVILWSLGNESIWSPNWATVNKVVKDLDPSRPTVFQDQCWGSYKFGRSRCDIANYHYPGLNAPALCDTMHRPTQFDEYLHVENYNRREVLTDPFIRADWGGPLQQMYDSIYSHKGNLGGAIWAGIDDIFHMPGGNIVGYGPWGVIDGWRRPKPEFWEMKKSYAPVIITNVRHPGYQSGKLILKAENRYDFTNLSSVKITFRIGDDSGIIKSAIPPHGEGNIEVPVSQNQLKKNALLITFTDPRGFICQQELIRSEKQENSSIIGDGRKTNIQFHESGNSYFVSMNDASYRISKGNGEIEKADINGIHVISKAPVLMIVPLNDDDGDPKTSGCNYQRNIRPLLYAGCKKWKASSVTSLKGRDGSVMIISEGEYDEAKGKDTLKFSKNGMVTLDYSFVIKDSTAINPRQWGIIFILPASYQTFTWKREGRWTIYPANDIARNEGTAKANPVHLPYGEPWSRPKGLWSGDANDLGSRDFRSTKAHIYSARLTDSKGTGIEVLSNGEQAARSWIDGDRVLFLIAEYNTGGSEKFSAGFYRNERRPLASGNVLRGTVRFKLIQ
jgi:hypothetical protein